MRHFQQLQRVLAMSLGLLLCACAVGPDYRAPQTGACAPRRCAGAAVRRAEPEAAWWQEFDDTELDGS